MFRYRRSELPQPQTDPKAKPKPLPGRYSVTFNGGTTDNGATAPSPEPNFVSLDVRFKIDGVPFRLRPTMHFTVVDPIVIKLDRNVIMVPKGKAMERTFTEPRKPTRKTEDD